MPRISRKNQLQGNLTYHIFNRGNAKLDVFHDDCDFEYFLNCIKLYKKKYNLQIYHWVLMSNHFHLSISIDIPDMLSKSIGGLQQAYVQYHHKRWKSAGKLWQGRFKSQPVQKEQYLYECGRYIERNPMRAGIVNYPWEYKWSSCPVYANNKPDSITTFNPDYMSFGKDPSERVKGYKEWLMEGESGIFNNMDAPVGDKVFFSKLVLESGRRIGRRRGRPPKLV
ncbi:MAG: transposase [Candidatus Omnitrophota bacterium]